MRQGEALRMLGDLAADQWGMVTVAQALDAGVDRGTIDRLVSEDLLERLARGVYALPGASEAERHTAERTAWLRLDPARLAHERVVLDEKGGVLSHRSAARLLRLGELRAGPVELTVPRRRTTRHRDVHLRVGTLAPEDVMVVDLLHVTTAARTIADLLADGEDGGHVGAIISEALRRAEVEFSTLVEKLAPYAAKRGYPWGDGRALVRGLLTQVDPGLVTLLETPDAEILTNLRGPEEPDMIFVDGDGTHYLIQVKRFPATATDFSEGRRDSEGTRRLRDLFSPQVLAHVMQTRERNHLPATQEPAHHELSRTPHTPVTPPSPTENVADAPATSERGHRQRRWVKRKPLRHTTLLTQAAERESAAQPPATRQA
ncbi:hypothetical protein GCM10022247_35820 [Allokutzneria multivorans]|uniref:AbiEi antitoxin N-terminal domain-containing protein n=1 Tax=Allokutzneria multivorans TaxID=1142134 RepID=A0ABP7SEA4_9PSEU